MLRNLEYCIMRHKHTWFVWGLIILAMTGCRPKVKRLTATLETFEAKDCAGEWTLTGVRMAGSDSIIVEADTYKKIGADENFIIATKSTDGANQFWVYELSGLPVGWFDTFNHIKSDNSVKMDYYSGTNYDKRFYYFPKTGVGIWTGDAARYEQGQDYMLILDGDEWKAFTFDGDSLISLPK